MQDDIQQPGTLEEQGASAPKATKKKSLLSPMIAMFGVGGTILIAFVVGLAIAFSFIKFRDPAPVTYAGGYNGGSLGCYLEDDAFEDTTPMLYGNNPDDDGYSKAAEEAVKRLSLTADKKEYIKKIISTSYDNNINPAILISFWGAEQSFNISNADKAFSCYIDGDKHLGFQQSMQCAIEFTIKPVLGRPYVTNAVLDQAKYNSQVSLYGGITTPDKIVHRAGTWDRLLYHYVAAAKKDNYDNFGYTTDEKDARIQILKKLVPDQVVCRRAEGLLDVDGLHQCDPSWSSMCDAGCNYTSLAMIDRFFGGNKTPIDIKNTGLKVTVEEGQGGSNSYFANNNTFFLAPDGHKITMPGESFPSEWVSRQLSQEHPILMRFKTYTENGITGNSNGHYVVIVGISTDGNKIHIQDPYGRGQPLKNGNPPITHLTDPAAYGTTSDHYKFEFWATQKK